jgi:fructokinase
VIVGEVLFDHFPSGKKVLGGAPFNVAWNLHGLGHRPLFISAVGQDESGQQVIQQMVGWGMDRSGVQQLSDHSTGKVAVTLESGQPSYEILPEQAYDFLDIQHLESVFTGPLKGGASLLYHGSLAWRCPQTRSVIRQLRQRVEAPIFVDLNIRQPWFDPDWLDGILNGVTWIKLNVHELAELTGYVLSENSSASQINRAVRELNQRFPAKIYFVTAGDQGAYAFSSEGHAVYEPTPKIERLVDTVGAGDAFAATAIGGLLKGWSGSEILESAVQFAAQVCQINGATVDDRAFYQNVATDPQ